MPLAGTGPLLGDAILAQLDAAVKAHPRAEDPDQRAAIWRAVGTAIVAHIVANATVAGTATGAAAGGPGVPVLGTIA